MRITGACWIDRDIRANIDKSMFLTLMLTVVSDRKIKPWQAVERVSE